MGKLDRKQFTQKQRELLEVEQEEEIEQMKSLLESSSAKFLEELGLCARKLLFSGESGGLFGKRIATFVLESATRKQKRAPISGSSSTLHIFGPGDIVAVFRSGDEKQSKDGSSQKGKEKDDKSKKTAELSGVVYRVSHDSLTIAFDDDNIELDDHEAVEYHVVKLTNDLTFRRMRTALDKLDSINRLRSSSLVNTLFGDFDAATGQQQLSTQEFESTFHCTPDSLRYSNVNLDGSQRDAVRFALEQRYVAIVHGPPGTGKTTTLIEIISQLVRSGQKVLACAPSNVAVDNLAERLVDGVSRRIVRIGHPARTNARVQPFTLDALLSARSEIDAARLCADVRSELDAEFNALKRVGRDRTERAAIRQRISSLRSELREREQAAVKHVLGGADVVLATLTSAGDDGPLRCLADDARYFDVVVIDECSQAIEAACWIAIAWARKLIIAGDHLQLPPTVISRRAARGGLSVSLMERLLDDTFSSLPSHYLRMLTVQYRMNETIMNFSSRLLYADQLVAADSVRNHLLRDLLQSRVQKSNLDVAAVELPDTPFLFIDTAGCAINELEDSGEPRCERSPLGRVLDGTQSKANIGECELVYRHVATLIEKLGVEEHEIAVMSPYNRQVDLLRAALCERFPNVEVRTIDAFQGREKEAVVLSLVRSNDRLEIGFLSDRRRLNVAITRARRHLCVIADADTLRGRPDDSDAPLSTAEKSEEDAETKEAYRLGRAFLRAFVEYCETTENVHYWTPSLYAALWAREREEAGTGVGAGNKDGLDSNVAFQRLRNKLVNPNDGLRGLSTKVSSSAASSVAKKKRVSNADSATSALWTVSDSRKNQLSSTIEEFAADENRVKLEFPASLSSYERFLVHSLAEKAGLTHASVGEAENRRITLFKRENKCQERQSADGRSSKQVFYREDVKLEEDEEEVMSSNEKANEESDTEATRGEQTATTISKKKKKKKSKMVSSGATSVTSSKVQTVDVECALERAAAASDEALLAEAKRLNERCNVIGCRERERHALIGSTCQFCGKRFCVHHSIPELHGCGDEAKAEARAAYRKQMLAAASGSATANPTGRSPGCYGSTEQKTAIRREFLQKKLDKKLEKLSTSRKPNSGSSKK